ncbi:cellulase family glycosylhydrolase [Bacteroides sp. 519]|uniref:cellulase family glycosylhydrolase n=1 Tax=Bacteroides sp. 519 TaxID=2302937 RepID=UPI0013D22C97|nr:cellulase family glycosylhydrolase [Bacteroides sp. 519]NDV60390.1 glycosyl hydrolase family 5 [Bacteroides sp. 519]
METTIKQFKMSLTLIVLSFVSLLTIACSDSKDPVTPEITVANPEIKIPKAGGTETLSIKSNVTLEVKSNDESWCHVAPATSASATIYKYTVTIDANPNTKERSTTIIIKGGNITETVNVLQPANDGLIIPQTTFNDIAGTGADIEVKLTTNGTVTATCNDSWITKAPTRAMAEQVMTFKVAANYGEARTGTITFTLGNLTETVTVNQLAKEIPNAGMESDALVLAAKIYAGWNIGNTLEAYNGETPSETAWGNPKITESYVKRIKELGFNAVRLPCAWNGYIVDEATYKIKDSWLDRVNEVVGYCVSNDMYAIVNIHWDGGWLENNCTPGKQEENNKKQKALWTQIANKLNHYDEHLLFAGCNEPNVETAEQMAVLKSYEQTFIDAVRATGGNNAVRNLIVQGPKTDIETTDKLFDMPTDVVKNRMMVEVHYYNPWTFCGMDKDEDWGRMAYFWGDYKVAGSDRNATFGDEAEMKALFARMKTKFVDKGIPVILGEYGAITLHSDLGENQEAHNLSRNQYDATATREAKNHGLVPFYWETGRIINRSTGEVKDNYAYDGIMKGAKEGKYPY